MSAQEAFVWRPSVWRAARAQAALPECRPSRMGDTREAKTKDVRSGPSP